LTFTDLHDFAASLDGANPWSQLTKSSAGDLYGTTVYGGSRGGGSEDGTLYKISSNGIYSQLYAFDGNAGQNPVWQPIIATDGKLYGTSWAGGSGVGTGTVYQYDLSSNTMSIFANFDGINAYYPNAITQGIDKNFYGTSQYGGLTNREVGFVNGSGSAFKVSSIGTITLLVSFHINIGGYNPNGMVQGPDGQFYGTTDSGGYYSEGTVYKSDANGKVTILHHFNSSRPVYEGAHPVAALIVGKDGNLYGSTTLGGVYGNGTIYKISKSGAFSVLYSLQATQGQDLEAPLMQGKDGFLYGVAKNGGGGDSYGTIFKLAGSTFTVLHHFANINGQGCYPLGGLTQDSVGNLYGTTGYGGVNGGGTIYEINTSGTSFNTIYSFNASIGNIGYIPTGSLIYTEGVMYGTTLSGGLFGIYDGSSGDNYGGTIYKFTPMTTTIAPIDVHDFSRYIGLAQGYGLSLSSAAQ